MKESIDLLITIWFVITICGIMVVFVFGKEALKSKKEVLLTIILCIIWPITLIIGSSYGAYMWWTGLNDE